MKKEQIKVFIDKDRANELRRKAFNEDVSLSKLIRIIIINYLIKDRLEYLRTELINERISYSELLELQSLIPYIDKNDLQLLEAAGVPEFKN